MRRLLSPVKGPGSHNASIDENYYRIRETFASERLYEEVSTPIPLDFSSFLAKKFAAGSIKGSIFTLICSTLGTGLLLMPNAIAESGIIWGVVQIILCAFLSHYSLIILVKCGEGFGAYSYQALAEITYGKWYKQLVNIVFFLTCWGASIAILIMTSQLVAKACENLSDPNTLPNWMTDPFSKIWPIIIATLIVLPLSLPKELKQLRYICLLSFFFVVVLAGIVLYESFVWNDVSANFHATKLVVPQGFTNTFATAIFAFACHPNALDIFKELQYANERRMRKVINRSLAITAATYFVIGVFGYFTFAATAHILTDTHLANGVILFAYGYYDSGASRSYPIIVDIGLVLIGISLVITQPMCIKPAKESIEEMFCSRLSEGTKWEKIRHLLLTLFTVYSAVGVGIFVKSIPDLINVLASSLLSLMCFVMPATFYLKFKEGEPFKGHKLACLILVIVSLIFGTYATVINLIELINANYPNIPSL